MKKINLSVLFLLTVLLIAEISHAQQPLVGKWELVYAEGGMHSKEFSNTFLGPSGSWLILKEDGTYLGKHDSTGIGDQGTWVIIEPNILKLNVISSSGLVNPGQIHAMNTLQRHEFRLYGDTLEITTKMRDMYTLTKYVKR